MADDYFDDEEDPVVRFEQDPESDDIGTGYSTRKSGARVYGPLGADRALELYDAGQAEIPGMDRPKTAPLDAGEKAKLTASPEDVSSLEQGLAQQKPAAPAKPAPEAPSGQPSGVQIPSSSRIASEHNNPGNLKFAGQAGATEGEAAKDGGHFARFGSPEAGLEALGKQVSLDASRGKTLGQFVSGYAPPGSNDTATYLAQAQKTLGATADTPLSSLDPMKVRDFIAQKESSTQASGASPALPVNQGRDTQGQSQQSTASASQQGSVSRTGSAQSEEQFQQQQGDIDAAYRREGAAQTEGAQGVADAIQNRRAKVMQMAQDKEAATTATMAQQEARAQQAQAKINEVASRKTDHNKIWKDKGIAGTALGLLAVGLRSLNATKFGGPNTALQAIQEQKKQNLQAQMEDRDSELRGLEKELGSIEAAKPMLEARMNQALSMRIDALTADEKSATVLANAKAMKTALDTQAAKNRADSAKAHYGTLATQQSTSQQLQRTAGTQSEHMTGSEPTHAAAGKSAADLMGDAADLDKKLEERGHKDPELRAELVRKVYPSYAAAKGETGYARTNREQEEKVARDESNLNEDQAKAESAMATLSAFGGEGGLTRDPKTGKWAEPGVVDNALSNPGWKEPLTKLWGGATPFADAQVTAAEALGRLASGGAITPDEEKRFKSMVGEQGLTKAQLASRLNSIETLVNARRKAKFKDQGTRAPDAWKKKPEEEASP